MGKITEATIYLSLGSNLNQPKQNILNAYNLIEKEIGVITKKSNFLENEAQGFHSETKFINTAIEVLTNLTPLETLKKTQQIETELGRKNKTSTHYESRIIDIDLLLFNSEKIHVENLEIPHPLMHERDFVLIPMMEIAPYKVVPGQNKTIQELFTDLSKHQS
jgi:2-amino-4-hydroxy-6-hydroxymethyldihydropteridine diphosphokinase